MPTVLIIEDEAIVAMELTEHLESFGYRVVGPAVSYSQAIAEAARQPPDLVLADRRIVGTINGIQTGAEIKKRHGSKLVVLTAHSDKATAQEASSSGADAILYKPFRVDLLRETLHAVLTR